MEVPQHTTLISDLCFACTGTHTFPYCRRMFAAWEGEVGQRSFASTSSRCTRRGTCTTSFALHRHVARLFRNTTCRSLLASGVARRLWCRHVSPVPRGSGGHPLRGRTGRGADPNRRLPHHRNLRDRYRYQGAFHRYLSTHPRTPVVLNRGRFGFKPDHFGFKPVWKPNGSERPGSEVDSEELQALSRCVLMGG